MTQKSTRWEGCVLIEHKKILKKIWKKLKTHKKTPTEKSEKVVILGHSSFEKTQSDADQDWKKFMKNMKEKISSEK